MLTACLLLFTAFIFLLSCLPQVILSLIMGSLGIVDFLKSARKIGFLIDPDNAECIKTMRKEGREEGGGRASQSLVDKKTQTLFNSSLEVHHSATRQQGAQENPVRKDNLFLRAVSWCCSSYSLMRSHSFLVVPPLKKVRIYITKLGLKTFIKVSQQMGTILLPLSILFFRTFFFFIKWIRAIAN